MAIRMLFIAYVMFMSCSVSIGYQYRQHMGCHIKMQKLRSDISDEQFNEILMQEPGNDIAANQNQKKGSGVADYYVNVLKILGKVPTSRLRELITKYKASQLPEESEDTEAHIAAGLDATWSWVSKAGGGWPQLIEMLDTELGEEVQLSTRWLQEAVALANQIPESRIKDLIVLHDSLNAIPKLDKRKFEGKFLKGDFITALIDILRENNKNSYEQVAGVLQKEAARYAKKGFGEMKPL